jgi:hypothetical protein
MMDVTAAMTTITMTVTMLMEKMIRFRRWLGSKYLVDRQGS